MSDTQRYSLLDRELLSVDTANGPDKLTLPAALAGLVRGEVHSFRALQAHQWQAWFSFLSQLAAMAVSRHNDGKLPNAADEWRELLLSLSGDEESAWALVEHDVSRPAFLQSPVPEGSLDEAGYKSDIPTPDGLDMLVTSKNHDVKRHRIRRPDVEHWLYALVTLQTLEGFLGRGNYGIVRMNGGFAARPFVEFTPGLSWSERFREDVDRLLTNRKDIADQFEFDESGHALLWMEPWDGAKSSGYSLDELDPYFLEICRRIRFRYDDALECWRCNTKGARVYTSKSFAGITGDPWTPIEGSEKAMNVVASGFPYTRVRELLFGEKFTRPPLLEIDGEAGYFFGAGLARGQGKTDGLHRRIVEIGEQPSRLFGDRESRNKLAELSKARIERTARAKERVLRPALYRIVGGGKTGGVDYEEIQRWEDAFTAAVDEEFFPALWRDAELDEEAANKHWQEFLLEVAQEQLEDAIDAAPISAARRYRVIATAESIFESRAYDELPLAKKRNTNQEESSHDT